MARKAKGQAKPKAKPKRVPKKAQRANGPNKPAKKMAKKAVKKPLPTLLPPLPAASVEATVLDALFRTVLSRKGASPATSHSARLLSRGTAKIAQKLGEEAVETVIAAIENDRGHLIAESADLLFHLLVLLKSRGVKLEDVEAVLAQRTGMSGLEEKASRKREG